MKIQIAPSILSADRKNLRKDTLSVVPPATLLHIDIMDGIFVPNTTFTVSEIEALNLPIEYDIHLMVDRPDKYWIIAYAAIPQVRTIIIHTESKGVIEKHIALIKKLGKKVGLSLKPKTSVKTLIPYLERIDQVLVMSVEPGKGGQLFMHDMLAKITYLRNQQPSLDIAIDGGINDTTIIDAAKAGANIFVTGSYLFKQKNRKKTFELLEKKAKTNYPH